MPQAAATPLVAVTLTNILSGVGHVVTVTWGNCQDKIKATVSVSRKEAKVAGCMNPARSGRLLRFF